MIKIGAKITITIPQFLDEWGINSNNMWYLTGCLFNETNYLSRRVRDGYAFYDFFIEASEYNPYDVEIKRIFSDTEDEIYETVNEIGDGFIETLTQLTSVPIIHPTRVKLYKILAPIIRNKLFGDDRTLIDFVDEGLYFQYTATGGVHVISWREIIDTLDFIITNSRNHKETT